VYAVFFSWTCLSASRRLGSSTCYTWLISSQLICASQIKAAMPVGAHAALLRNEYAGFQVVVAAREPGTSVLLLRRCPQARLLSPD